MIIDSEDVGLIAEWLKHRVNNPGAISLDQKMLRKAAAVIELLQAQLAECEKLARVINCKREGK